MKTSPNQAPQRHGLSLNWSKAIAGKRWRTPLFVSAVPLLIWMLSGISASGQQPVQLINATTTVWRYHTNQNGVNPGYSPADAWILPGFVEDATWGTGPGLFGFESSIYPAYPMFNTYIVPPNGVAAGALIFPGQAGSPLSPGPTGADQGPRSTYLRAHFQWTNAQTAGVTFITTNYIDDGMIVWLNGVEIYAFNVPATRPLPYDVNTLPGGANPAPFGEPSVYPTNVAALGLVQGDNVIAVQWHQQANTSSDDVYGLNLWAVTPTPIVITSQPPSKVVAENHAASLFVGITGSNPQFQWYKGTNPAVLIPDQTNQTFLLTNALIADSGDYFVIITNAVNSRTSQVAHLSVIVDTNGPVLLSIKTDDTFQQIILTWDEVVAQGPAIESGSYFLTDPQGNQVDITSVIYNGSNVVLQVAAPLLKGTNYAIEIDYQTDIVNNPTKPVGMPQLDPNGVVGVVRTWVTTGGFTKLQLYTGLPAGQSIAQFVAMPIYPNSPNISFYTNVLFFPQTVPGLDQFAMRFTGLYVATETGTHRFDVSHDDEMRFRIHSGDTSGSSSNELGAACCTGLTGGPTVDADLVSGQSYFYELIVREFTGGDNGGVAVTMPSGRVSSPIGSDLMAATSDPVTTPNAGIGTQPQNQSNSANHSVTFSVVVTNSGGAVAYQWQRNVGGAGFTNIPGALNATYTTPLLPITANGDQYRVIAAVPGRVLTSASATSTITNDTVRPRVLAARGNRNLNAVTVTFDEAMDIIGATNVANYLITNTVGGASLAINSATLSVDLTTVTLATGPQTPGAIYNLRVQNVADLAANVITTTNVSFRVWIYSPGFVLKELYTGLGGGTTIGDLTNATKYPNAPDIVRYGTLAELNDADEFDNYGARLSAVITPPLNGNYYFFLATDDPGELWLSTDSNPANRALVAREPVWANRREWTGVGGGGGRAGVTNLSGGTNANITGPINLVAGQRYYIESIMKEGGGGDNNGFTWQIPGGPAPVNTTTRGIGGYSVIAALADPVGAFLSITQQPASTTVAPGTNASFFVGATGVISSGAIAPLVYQWQRNVGGTFTDIAGANGATYNTANLVVGDSGSQFRALVFSPGAAATSAVATVTVGTTPTGPTLRLSQSGGTLNFSWEAGARLQYTLSLTPPIIWKDINTGSATNYSVVLSNEFNVLLDPLQEPPPRGTGSGSGTVTVSNNTLVVDVVYGGLSGTRNNSHFHAPAPRGVNAGVVYSTATIDSATGLGTNAGTIKGIITLLDVNASYPGKNIAAQLQDMRNGLWYLNVHSTTFGGGEIRGQVEPGARFYRLVSP